MWKDIKAIMSLIGGTTVIGTAEINKVIRKIITPVFKQNGLTKARIRNFWG